MTPTNDELAEALRSIEGLPLGTQLVVRLAADRLSPPSHQDRGGWVEWHGQHVPTIFKAGQVVETRHRSGEEYTGIAAMDWQFWSDAQEVGPKSGYWVHDGKFSNIIAYRVIE